MTESVLCSARKESGHVPKSIGIECGRKYLLPQLSLLAHALVVALGRKAERRLKAVGFNDFLAASAIAPPGCNRFGARATWDLIPIALAKRRAAHATNGAEG